MNEKKHPTSPSSNPRRVSQATLDGSPADGDRAASSTAYLTVNQETVAAADLWGNESEEEEARKAQILPSTEYAAFVNRRAARLVADKIAEMLLYQSAAARLTEEERKTIDEFVDVEIRRRVTEEYGGVQGRFERELARRSRTVEDERRKLRREMTIARHLEIEVKANVPQPSRAELLAAFEASRQSLRRPERRRMSLIEVRTLDRLPPEATEPTREQLQVAREEARSRILAAQSALRSGEDFAGVARRYSDSARAAEGGAWGWVAPGSVRERYEPAVEALYRLAPGEVSDVLEFRDDFFLVRCDEFSPAVEHTFETAQPELVEQLTRAAYQRAVADHIERLRKKARILPSDLDAFHRAVVAAAPPRR